MKKTLLTLTLLGATLMTGCSATEDMTTATNTPTSTMAPAYTTAPDGMGDGMMEGTPDGTGTTDGMTDGSGMMDGMMDSLGDGSELPNVTEVPAATGVTSMDKARRVVEQIEDELERLSEVDDAEVVIAGNKAAVALEFDDQYKGGIDDRLRGIVKDRIASVISGISTIAITADENIMETIEALGDRLDTISDMNALQSDLDAIIRKIDAGKA